MLAVLRRPDLALRLVAVLLSAIPIGMLPLALVVDGLDRAGAPSAAGALAAALAIGSAAGVLGQGALLVRIRPAVLLPVSGLLGLAASAVVAAVPPVGAGLGIAALGAGLTGATIPAVTTAVRGRLTAVVQEDGLRIRSYAALNVLFQAGLALGPVAAATLAAAGLARTAAPAAAVVGLAAAAVVAVVDRRAPAGRAVMVRRPRTATRRGGLPVLLLVAAACGAGLGSIQVAVPAAHVGSPGTAGVAFAALALGEAGGALAAAGRVTSRSSRAVLRVGLLAMAALYALGALLGGGAAVVGLLAAIGVATAVQSVGSAVLLDRVVAPRLVTAAFAGVVSSMLLGTSAGAVLAGVVGTPAVLLVPAALLVVAALAGGLLPSRAVPAAPERRRALV